MLSEKNFQHSLCSWWDSCDQGVPSFSRSERRSREKPRGKMYSLFSWLRRQNNTDSTPTLIPPATQATFNRTL